MKEKTILFVMPRLPFPMTSGRKTSLYHYCRILSVDLGYRLIVAAFMEKDDNKDLIPDFIDRLIILPKPSRKTKVFNVFVNSCLLKNRPLQVSLYWNKDAKKIIDLLVLEEKPDIVIADMVRTTEYIKYINAYRIADLDDRISLRYKRQMESDMESINPYGAYLSTLPQLFQKVLLWKPIKKRIMHSEAQLLYTYEISIGKTCDATIFVAQAEADTFNYEIGYKKAVAIPIGVDVNYFNKCLYNKNTHYIGFLGAMNVSHNESAVINFIENIFPYVLKKMPLAIFMVIGGGVSERLNRYKSNNIVFTNRVIDVRDYLCKCSVFVCPMTFGSGIKTKNLEAMSMKLPVVTTSIGAENINAISGRDWLITDDNVQFANYIIDLLNNKKLCEEIGTNARNFILSHYVWNVARENFTKLLHK